MNSHLNKEQCCGFIAELAELLPELMKQEDGDVWFAPLSPPAKLGARQKWEPVFTGGAIVGLLLSDPAASPPSKTKDIDLVLEIAGYHEFAALEQVLRRSGFSQNPLENMPVVAWYWKSIRVDFLPDKPMEMMSKTNRWFPHLIAEAVRLEVTKDRFAWVASAPCFIATKLEAFRSRGKGNYLESKDIEDIIAVVDGREELAAELENAHPEIRQFLQSEFRMLLEADDFMNCLPQIVPDESRESVVISRIKLLLIGKPTR